ncbi:hypothetical protein M378DRAFT_755771 [Amanita muscaria Koide BX008]|uniref:Uncharacterized protein n=1 Tax=Amanita muscaria (strain Koide BX008) TaxID=946122 RepID=A0A0C2X1I8_AMAMK|nr:hypothetical protein M378DRAFT_755771 [Amanita muscaria Koide BX008]
MTRLCMPPSLSIIGVAVANSSIRTKIVLYFSFLYFSAYCCIFSYCYKCFYAITQSYSNRLVLYGNH